MAECDSSKLDLQEEYEVGYEIDPVGALSDDLNCGICHHVVRDAQQTMCCGHSTCKQCIDKVLQTKIIDKKCPYCSNPDFKVVTDKKTQRQVLNLVVYCPHKQIGPEPGCVWKGELRSREKHLNDDCPFTEVYCTNGCQKTIQRRRLEDHLKLECKLRQVCKYCNGTGYYQQINGNCEQKEWKDLEANSYKQLLAETQRRLEVVEQNYKELQQQLECSNIQTREKLSAFDALDWMTRLNGLASKCSRGLPMVIKMPDFTKSNQDEWSSLPFTTGIAGYKMFIKVYPNGYRHGEGYGKFISVALFLMSGEHDEELSWPFKGIVNIQLLNQLENKDHSQVVEFKFNGRDPKMCQRVTDRSHAERACWAHKFISHDALQYNYHRKHQYLKDKCIFFNVQSFVR